MKTQASDIKKLNNHQLHEKIKSLAAEERTLTKEIVEYISELDRRKLYLDMACSSLYEYLTTVIAYSEGAAQRRIDAARLMQRVPEISNKIESGALKLSQISKLQKACRSLKKDSGKIVSAETQRHILKEIENLGAAKTDLILAKEFGMEVKTTSKQRIQSDESIRIELTFSKQEMALVKRAQELLSNQTGGKLKETILKMAEKLVQQSQGKKSKEFTVNADIEKDSARTMETKTTATVAVKSVTPKLRYQIINRDKFCQFTDHNTGRVCGSKLFLEVDHIRPRFAGGDNATTNLRVLCKNHNMYRYQAGR